MSMILNTEHNWMEYQSHRVYPANWNGDGWIPVPPEYEEMILQNAPYFTVTYKDEAKTEIENVEIIPEEDRPKPEPIKWTPGTVDQLVLAMLEK